MQDRPTAEELLAAVRQFLEQELIPTISDQRLRFRGLIAAHVLAQVERELAAGIAPIQAEYQRLALLTGHAPMPPTDPQELQRATRQHASDLCAAIRRGAYDGDADFARAMAYAEQALLARLRIANPRAAGAADLTGL